MSTLAQIRHERIEKLEYDLDYLRGQVDCLWGNPANIGNTAYRLGYAMAYEMQARKTAQAEALEWTEECF